MITPMVWFFFFQDDVIIRRVSLVCFSLFFAATCWQRIAVIFHMYRVFPMMLAPKNKNAKVKKKKDDSAGFSIRTKLIVCRAADNCCGMVPGIRQ